MFHRATSVAAGLSRAIAGLAVFLTLAGVIFLAGPAPALAEETTVPLGGWFEVFHPYLETAVAVIVLAVVGWIAAAVQRFTGIEIEGKHREALQSALEAGARAALNRLGDRASSATIDVRHELLAVAEDYVRRSTPDALDYFGVTPERLKEMLEARLPSPDSGHA